MSEQKKPQAGEFWDMKSTRLLIVGTKRNGAVVAKYECGTIGTFRVDDNWKHLPDCDSFDWQPETFPQWIVSRCDDPWIAHAYLKRISSNTYERYLHNGEKDSNEIWGKHEADGVTGGWWKQVTQAEAEARVKKPEPVESPDDWVTQDRVPDRPGIDEWRRVFNGIPDHWKLSGDEEQRFRHGHTALQGQSVFEVRCRRKDLPPLPQETLRKSYIKLWLNQQSGHVSITDSQSNIELVGCDELKHDGTGFYLEDGK